MEVTLPVSWGRCFSRLNDAGHYNVAHNPVHQYRHNYYRHGGLRACRDIRLAFVP